MEGRERLPRIKSNYTVLPFSFIEMFAEDLAGSCAGRLYCGTARQVCFYGNDCVHVSQAASGGCQEKRAGGKRVVTQLKNCHRDFHMTRLDLASNLRSTVIVAVASGVWK